MSIDLGALIRALQQDPEQRAALAHVLLGGQPDVSGALAALAEAQRRTEQRVDELAKDMRELARAQQATEQSLGSLVDVVKG